MDIDYPFHIKQDGSTADAASDDHIRELIEQVLFTSPGERVNRPTFGSGLNKLVFSPNSDAQSATLQLTVPSSLTQWLGDLIQVQGVDISNDDSSLSVTVRYVIRKTQEPQVAQFSRSVGT
jgi:Bacteriophage baseplate protein W